MATVLIDNRQIVQPASIEIGKFRLTKAQRTADGTMVMELIATKRQVQLGWAVIAAPDLDYILDLLDTGVFHQLTFPDPQGGESMTITVYVGDISYKAWQYRDGVRYWRDVSITLIER